MGRIHENVTLHHLRNYPSEREILLPFLKNFDVTHGQRKNIRGSSLSFYLLKPEKPLEEQFGIVSEILLTICDYQRPEARTFLIIEQIFNEYPCLGRVDQTSYFLIVRSAETKNEIKQFEGNGSQDRMPIVISMNEIRESKGDDWFVRNAMLQQLYSRDLFNEQLPLINDAFFFGRDQIVAEFLNAVKQSHNRGIFGLRKTGKTSVLFKLKKLCERDGIICFYYDCKLPSIRSIGWIELINRINIDIIRHMSKTLRISLPDGIHPSDAFVSVIKSASSRGNICIIFDEIEYISPIAKLDLHWKRDFIDFWQTLWTTQSQTRKLSFIIAGVNPTVVEIDEIDGVQNPVFGIVTPNYLTGLSDGDTRSLLSHVGRRMGLKFDYDASMHLYSKFGGHPLLTRMAGSFLNKAIDALGGTRPFKVTKEFVEEGRDSVEQEMAFYSRHIVSELRIFYPEEYEMLEMLASGNEADFIELGREPDYVRHLKSYGLIQFNPGERPIFKIPVLERYINLERQRRDRGQYEFQIVPPERRATWLKNRLSRIVSDSRTLVRIAENSKLPEIYDYSGFNEIERFVGIEIVENQDQFVSFVNICNRCLVESIENKGKSLGVRNYFSSIIKENYPNLWDSLLRTKLYRNNEMHISLYPKVDSDLKAMLDRDLKGKLFSEIEDRYFVLQQMILDGLFVGFQLDIDRLS